MSDASVPSPAQPRSRLRPRFSLLTLLLLIAATASWLAYWRIAKRTERIRAELPGLREIARSLIVEDPAQYAAVQQHSLWDDDFRWRVYLPPQHRYQVHLATDAVDHRGQPTPVASASIPPGKHELELRSRKADDHWQIDVLIDDEVRLSDTRPLEWNPRRGSSGASEIRTLRQSLTTQPLSLFRRRFMMDDSGQWNVPDGPTNGIALWIDTDNAGDTNHVVIPESP